MRYACSNFFGVLQNQKWYFKENRDSMLMHISLDTLWLAFNSSREALNSQSSTLRVPYSSSIQILSPLYFGFLKYLPSKISSFVSWALMSLQKNRELLDIYHHIMINGSIWLFLHVIIYSTFNIIYSISAWASSTKIVAIQNCREYQIIGSIIYFL